MEAGLSLGAGADPGDDITDPESAFAQREQVSKPYENKINM